MKLRPTLLLALGLTLVGQATALTVNGQVEGSAGSDTRLGAFLVSPFGQPLDEVSSTTITDGKFKLELPTAAPPSRAQTKLTAQNVAWPGVLDPVSVSSAVQTAELRFFTYRDQNGNGRRDENEALRDLLPNVGRASLFIAWVSGDVTVTANRGYEARLKQGWNAFLVDVSKAIKVTPYADTTLVNVRMGR